MVRQIKMVVGARFGRGVVIERLPYRGQLRKSRLRCDCGKEYIAFNTTLYAGMKQSCGCAHEDAIKARGGRWEETKKTSWKRWERMISRCHNPKDRGYKDYGGRGISVCDRWRKSFSDFFEDMGSPPRGRFSIDRIDNSGSYCKENCRWATDKQQASNRRNNHWYSLGERLILMADAAKEFGMCLRTLKSRICREGMTMDQALTLPLRKPGPKKQGAK